jgi:hypothetical protein
MGYLLKAGIGLALFIGAVILFNVQLQELLDVGTCASGNTPYVIANPCPEGTETKVLLLVGSIFGGLIGAGLFAFRGAPPWGQRRRSVGLFGFGTLAWGLFFAGTGLALLIGAPYGETVDPTTGEIVGRPDSQLGATITGVTFLVMGTPALLLGGWNVVRGFASRGDERPASASGGAMGGLLGRMRTGMEQSQAAQQLGARLSWGSGGGSGAGGRSRGGDTLGRIERLQKLRESGALSDAEFQREKAKILAEG